MEQQTLPPNEVVIAFSGVFDHLGIAYADWIPKDFESEALNKAQHFCQDTLIYFSNYYTKAPIKLICIGERMSAGRARNLAAKASTMEILSFVDSDDTEYPIRNEVIHNLFRTRMSCRNNSNPPLQMLLHGYRRNWPHVYEKKRKYTSPELNLVLPNDAYTGEQCVEQEKGAGVWDGYALYRELAKTIQKWSLVGGMAFGHPIVRRSVFRIASYSSLPHGEDSIFIRDYLYNVGPKESEFRVKFLCRPLTTYYGAGEANADIK